MNKERLTDCLSYDLACHMLPIAHTFVLEDEVYITNIICLNHAESQYEKTTSSGWKESVDVLKLQIYKHESVIRNRHDESHISLMKRACDDRDAVDLYLHCLNKLDIENASLSDEYYYSNISSCVVDAVFSIGIKYSMTRKVVMNFCDFVGINRIDKSRIGDDEYDIRKLISFYDEHDIDYITNDVFKSKNKTSTRNGILKSEAVYQFAKTLERFDVYTLNDVNKVIDNDLFENAIKKIPGQTSGISLKYFFMLAGSDAHIKPDRMIMRFISSATGKSVNTETAHSLLAKVTDMLHSKFPELTPRILDHAVWQYQRQYSPN